MKQPLISCGCSRRTSGDIRFSTPAQPGNGCTPPQWHARIALMQSNVQRRGVAAVMLVLMHDGVPRS